MIIGWLLKQPAGSRHPEDTILQHERRRECPPAACECVLNKKTYGLIPRHYPARHEITPCVCPIRKSNPTARCLQR